jgi:hypothetical protein
MKNADASREKAKSFQAAAAVPHTLFILKETEPFPSGKRGSYPPALPTPFSFGGGPCECPLLKARMETMTPAAGHVPME